MTQANRIEFQDFPDGRWFYVWRDGRMVGTHPSWRRAVTALGLPQLHCRACGWLDYLAVPTSQPVPVCPACKHDELVRACDYPGCNRPPGGLNGGDGGTTCLTHCA